MCSYYNLAAALEAQRVAEAEEKALEALFCAPIQSITLNTGTETITVPVSPKTGFLLIHELMLAAAAKREKVQVNLLDYRTEDTATKKGKKGGVAK